MVSTSQEVEIVVLDVDTEKNRISLGLKQCQENPWTAYAAAHKAGDEIRRRKCVISLSSVCSLA